MFLLQDLHRRFDQGGGGDWAVWESSQTAAACVALLLGLFYHGCFSFSLFLWLTLFLVVLFIYCSNYCEMVKYNRIYMYGSLCMYSWTGITTAALWSYGALPSLIRYILWIVIHGFVFVCFFFLFKKTKQNCQVAANNVSNNTTMILPWF